MRKKPVILFCGAAVFIMVTILGGSFFLKNQIGEVNLTEETLIGDVAATDGIQVGFRADSGEDLHWISSYDFTTKTTQSSFKRGELSSEPEYFIYDDFRFTTWTSIPYTTLLNNDNLDGLQEKAIQKYYNEIQGAGLNREEKATGEIRVKDYLDYYPISFRFQFGAKVCNSNDALTGLKILENEGDKSDGRISSYDEDVKLYREINQFFRIPVIENEYQRYEVTEDGLKVEIVEGKEADSYQFDPVIVLQEENLMDGKTWIHPDLAGGTSYEKDDNYVGKTGADYNLKNRMLFIVNNRTKNGEQVDFSQVKEGYGIYELPIETTATATVRYGRRSSTVPNPKPLSEGLNMVYALSEDAEYVEMSLSEDHRYVAVFSVENGRYYVEFVDADTWKSQGRFMLFKPGKRLSYVWGQDGSLAATNHKGEIAVICRAESEKYEMLYQGETPKFFDKVFFGNDMIEKENAYTHYEYGYAYGLAVVEKDGKVAFSQNLILDASADTRGPGLECAIIDKTGVIYWGKLHSKVTDLETTEVGIFDEDKVDADTSKQMIKPVRSENWIKWDQ